MTERPTGWARWNRSTLVVGALMVTIFLLSGCRWLGGNTNDLGIDYRDYLPVEWEPLGSWQDVNIDDDDTVEHLLFYRYEGGQVGGVIYDPQTNSNFAPAAEAAPIFALPNQPSIMMIPYRLLPSYWNHAGQGVLATPSQEVPTFIQVQRPTGEVDQSKDANGESKENKRTDELIIFGGNTHLSIFWWQDAAKGYGVAHMDAPGGLVVTNWFGKEGASTIMSVDGYYPEENNRSFFCRKVTYVRSMPEDPKLRKDDYRFFIGYEAKPQGLTFCPSNKFETNKTYPQYAFYPEATILAYLLHTPDERRNQKSMTGVVDPSVLEKVDGLVGKLNRVESLTYYSALIEVETSADTSLMETMQMHVVAELAVQVEDQEQIRFVTFALQHQPPTLKPKDDDEKQLEWRSDRWLIINAIDP